MRMRSHLQRWKIGHYKKSFDIWGNLNNLKLWAKIFTFGQIKELLEKVFYLLAN